MLLCIPFRLNVCLPTNSQSCCLRSLSGGAAATSSTGTAVNAFDRSAVTFWNSVTGTGYLQYSLQSVALISQYTLQVFASRVSSPLLITLTLLSYHNCVWSLFRAERSDPHGTIRMDLQRLVGWVNFYHFGHSKWPSLWRQCREHLLADVA